MTHEGTKALRLSKLQILKPHFENLRMKEDESLSEFNSRLCDNANGLLVSERSIVKKSLWGKLLDLILRDLHTKSSPSKKPEMSKP